MMRCTATSTEAGTCEGAVILSLICCASGKNSCMEITNCCLSRGICRAASRLCFLIFALNLFLPPNLISALRPGSGGIAPNEWSVDLAVLASQVVTYLVSCL